MRLLDFLKPNTFEIWKNDTMLNQSSHSKEYQKILEQNILKLNHKSFHQVVVLGSSSFIPFMQLPSGHRRQVIEDLLDINIFSKMNIIIKEKNIKLKTDIGETNHKIELNKTKVDTQKKYIKDIKALTEENKKDYRERIEKAQGEINALQSSNNDLTTSLLTSNTSNNLSFSFQLGFEAKPDVVSDSPHLTEIHKSLIGHSSLCFSDAHITNS